LIVGGDVDGGSGLMGGLLRSSPLGMSDTGGVDGVIFGNAAAGGGDMHGGLGGLGSLVI